MQINGVPVPIDENTEELIAMLSGNMAQFVVVCEALSYKTDNLSFNTLVLLLNDNDYYKRRIAVECLKNHTMFEKAIDDIEACLNDRSSYVVNAAIRTLVECHVSKSHQKIIELIQGNDETIRETAFFALEHIFEESDFDLALSLYDDNNEKIRKEVPYIVSITANEKNWHKAYFIMKESDNEKARLVACKLLDKFGSDEDKEDFKIFAQDENGHIRKFAKKCLSMLYY